MIPSKHPLLKFDIVYKDDIGNEVGGTAYLSIEEIEEKLKACGFKILISEDSTVITK